MTALRVFARPIGLHSRAMIRIANAIERYAPPFVKTAGDETIRPLEFVSDQSSADLVIFYPIGADWIPLIEEVEAAGKRFALVQCCVKSTGASCETWAPVWWRAECVWSYLDLVRMLREERGESAALHYPDRFYYAPLGIDDAFLLPYYLHTESTTVVTTGYVSGCPAEAIYEVWEAALSCGYHVTHVGPKLPGWRPGVRIREGVSDQELRMIYRSAAFVASLRYVEGFELPALEGLVSGATPILFDQPDLRHWYRDYALYVPEVAGAELAEHLKDNVFYSYKSQYKPEIIRENLRDVAARFDWSRLAGEFWQRILSNI